jgi:hypothetical protein
MVTGVTGPGERAVRITSLRGAVVRELCAGPAGSIMVPLDGLDAGLYAVRIRSGKKSWLKHFVHMK